MLLLSGAAALAYLLGSLSGSLLIGRWRGVDVRGQGSGNAGGTNAFRTQGWRFALAVVAIDIGKGSLAAWLGMHIGAAAPAPLQSAMAQGAVCGFAAVLGHCWPLYFDFRGGKGAATAVGVVLVLAPLLVLPVLGVWLLVLTTTGYVGLATVLATASLVVAAAARSGASPLCCFAGAVAALIVFTHRGNIARLVRGTEYRFDKARVLHRLLRRR